MPRTEVYIATDDREITRVDAVCNHRKCPPGNCIAYDEKTLAITPDDEALAKQLVADGWWSTSAKHRHVARWKGRPPTVEEIFGPALLATFHGQRMAAVLRQHERWHCGVGMPAVQHQIEHATLSPSLFRAFKAAGGDCGR